jgi:hypothetical protein
MPLVNPSGYYNNLKDEINIMNGEKTDIQVDFDCF